MLDVLLKIFSHFALYYLDKFGNNSTCSSRTRPPMDLSLEILISPRKLYQCRDVLDSEPELEETLPNLPRFASSYSNHSPSVLPYRTPSKGSTSSRSTPLNTPRGCLKCFKENLLLSRKKSTTCKGYQPLLLHKGEMKTFQEIWW